MQLTRLVQSQHTVIIIIRNCICIIASNKQGRVHLNFYDNYVAIMKLIYCTYNQSIQAVKGLRPCAKNQGEKVVKYREWPRNGCDGKSGAKIYERLFRWICVTFILGISTKFTWIAIIKIFSSNLLPQLFLGCHLYLTTFSTLVFLHRPIGSHLFIARPFLSSYISLLYCKFTRVIFLCCTKK